MEHKIIPLSYLVYYVTKATAENLMFAEGSK